MAVSCFWKAPVLIQYITLTFLCRGLWSFNHGQAAFVHKASGQSPFRLTSYAPSTTTSKQKQKQQQSGATSLVILALSSKDNVVCSTSTNATSSPANAASVSEESLRNASLSVNVSSSSSTSAPHNSGSSHNEEEPVGTSINATVNNPEREKIVAEAQALQEKAKHLRAEAAAEEASLKESRSTLRSQRIRDSDSMTDRLFHSTGLIPTNSTLATALEEKTADTFRSERWSPEQVLMVLERLHERQILAQDQPPIMTPSQAAVTRPTKTFQIAGYNTRNKDAAVAAVANETEWNIIDGWISLLINAASLLDDEYNDKTLTATKEAASSNPATVTGSYINARWTGRVAAALKTRRKELVRGEEEDLKRKIAYNVNAVMSASKKISEGFDDIQEYTRQTLGIPSSSAAQDGNTKNKNKRRELNATRVLERVAAVPMWVPSSLLPMLVESRATLRKEDVAIIKTKVLVGSRFFCTSSDAIPSAAVFRGNIRTPVGLVDVSASSSTSPASANHTAVVFEEIQQRLEMQGLANRVQLFMLEDQEWRPGEDDRAPTPLPVILAISKKVQPTESIMEKLTTSVIAKRASIAFTLVATFSYSVSCYALNPIFFESVVNQRDISVLLACIPLCLGVLSVQAFHETAHYLVARIRNIKIGRPTPIPSPQVGTFGCITPLLSFPSDRKALFDLALSGPLVGMIISLLMMFGGIQTTTHASEAALSHYPMVPVGLFKCSLLTSTMLSALAPKLMMLPLAQPIPIHPLFLSGFAGLISSALNLLPVFRLDGGRIISTLFGPRFTGVSSASTLLFMLSLTISGSSSIALTWGLMIVFLQRRTEVPVRDDVTQVNDFRMGAWVGAIVTAVLAITPFPGGPGFL